MDHLVTHEFLTKRLWSFYHKGSSPSGLFRFLPNGEIGIYNSVNERTWCIDDGVACVINEHGSITTRFDNIARDGSRIILSGCHLPNPKITLCLAEQIELWPKRDGTKVALAEMIRKYGWKIGDHTYGTPNIIEPSEANLTIGKYTSIAGAVQICLADHRTDTVSSYPFVSLSTYWPSVPKGVRDHVSKGDVRIGNDVWIGFDAFIGSGVAIGDGAVIGAKSTVTRNVPPFAIVAGNPGRVIRYRFSEKIISELLKIEWWNWPEEVVDSYLPLMLGGDIQSFLASAQKLTLERIVDICETATRPGR